MCDLMMDETDTGWLGGVEVGSRTRDRLVPANLWRQALIIKNVHRVWQPWHGSNEQGEYCRSGLAVTESLKKPLYKFSTLRYYWSVLWHVSWMRLFVCQGHQDFVNCLAVSPSGNFVVSGSHDRSVRLWEKSDEILVLSEEREMVRFFTVVDFII